VTTAPDPLLGALLGGRYRVNRLVAEGGMGAIYEAENTAIGKRVAVKVLHAHYARDQEIVARFRREAFAATAIGHEHIIDVLDLGLADDGSVYMVLELLEGRDLAAEIRAKGPLRIAHVVHIASQVCEALAAVHAKDIVHRDLKPENVFLVERGGDKSFVKVLDFGISKVKAALGTPEDAATRTGTALGTPYYMAPEQARGAKDVDHRVDLYALGVMMFRALTGQHPFDDASFPMLVLKICTEPPPPVRRYRGDVPEALEALILKLLAKDREQRFADARAVHAALAEFRALDTEPVLLDAPRTSELATSALDALDRAGLASTQPATGTSQPRATGPGTSQRPQQHQAIADDDEEVAPPPAAGFTRWLPLAGLALVAVAAVTIGVAVFGGRAAPPRRVERNTLPAPSAARVAPLAGPDRRGGEGWRWINPLPRALPTYLGVDVGGTGLIAMVGRNGAAARVNRGGLATWPTGTTENLEAVAFTGAREALAVGASGTIQLLGDAAPTSIPSGTEVALHAVLAVSATEALVAGDGGTLLRIINRAASPVATRGASSDAALLALAQQGTDSFAVGERGTVLRISPQGAAKETSGTAVTLRGVGGCPGADLYAAGDGGVVLRRSSAGAWTALRDTGTEAWTGVDCDGDRVAISGARGGVLLVQGDHHVRLDGGGERPWYGVAGAHGERTWLVGAGGRLATIDGDHVRVMTDGPTGAIRDLAVLGGALVAVGEYGRISRERESGFRESTSPTSSGLGSVIALGPDRLVAVGDDGALVEIFADRSVLRSSPSRAPLRDVVGDSAELLIVGGEGTLLRGPLATLLATRVPDTGDLWAVAGTPSDAIAVGADGATLRVTTALTTKLPCAAAAGRTLRGVVRASVAEVLGDPNAPLGYAAGDGGLIVRIEERGCQVEHDGGPTLQGIGRGPHGRPFAVGDEGAAFERGEDGAWTPVPLEVAGQSLRAVVRADRYVYIAGTGGVVLRHVLLDGT
jgi:serine/threonine-protein kinase